MTPWCKEDTATILKSFGWVNFFADARRISISPGSSQFSFSSLGVDPADYARTVLVIDDASRWSNATMLQHVEVCHTREGKDMADSMELLYALSRCIFFSEWYLRYPSSSIASCVALSNTTVFAFCRFFVEGTDTRADLMQLISRHGGHIVHTATEATHILLPPPLPVQRDGSSSTTSSSLSSLTSSSGDGSESESVGSGAVVDSTETDSSDEESEDRISVSRSKNGGRPVGDGHADCSSPCARVSVPCAAGASPPLPSCTAAQSTLVETIIPSNTASHAVTVTVRWLYRCIRALRLVPIEIAAGPSPPSTGEVEGGGQAGSMDNNKEELAAKTDTLLCALLPPPDARPLLWKTLQSIASQHGYDAMALVQRAHPGMSSKTVTAASILEVLTSPIYSDVVDVRLQPLPMTGKSVDGSSTSSRSRGTSVTRRTLDSLKLSAAPSELSRITLYRFERRRDKEAVFAHLQLIAAQFLYSFDYVQQQKLKALHCHAGTQTSGVRHASMGTMTEGEEVFSLSVTPEEDEELAKTKDTATASKINAGVKVSEPAPPARTLGANAAESMADNAAGAVDEREWRQHLSNAEGKMLMSHIHDNRVSDREGNQGLQENLRYSKGLMDAEACVKATRAPVRHLMEHGESAEVSTTMVEEDRTDTTLLSSNMVAGHYRDEPPPAVPPPTRSLLKPPSSLLPLPPMTKPIDVGDVKADVLPGEFTACFIPTSVLTTDQQSDFYAFLCSLPLFNDAELGNGVVRLTDGVQCQFADHKGAKDFLRIDFVEFLSLHLPIYPVLSDSVGLEDLQRTVMDFPLLLPPVQSEVSHEEAQSLWAAREAPESTKRASTHAAASREVYVSEGVADSHRHESGSHLAYSKSSPRRGRDSTSAASGGRHPARCDTRADSHSKRGREDSTEEASSLTDSYRHRDRHRTDHHGGSSLRRIESSSLSHRRPHYADRSEHHRRSTRDHSDRGSRSDVHHRLPSRRDRR